MRVQSIQTTNDCRKPCFKAHFVNDAAGNFRKLWETASIDKNLDLKIESFASKHLGHSLEITGVRDGYSKVNSGHDAATVFGSFYGVFNHFTGKFAEYFVNGYACECLFNLLSSIENDKGIFEDDSTAKIYQYLTGQAKPQTEK